MGVKGGESLLRPPINFMERYYSFKVVTYHTDIEIIKSFCKNCFKYAYILHDKDDTDSHYHILCTFKQNKSFESVRAFMPEGQNTFVQPMKDKRGDYDYLTHLNCPEKYQYDSSAIVCNDLSYFAGKLSQSLDNEEFYNDLTDPTKSLKMLAIRYGRDFMRNFARYREFLDFSERELCTPVYCSSCGKLITEVYDSCRTLRRDTVKSVVLAVLAKGACVVGEKYYCSTVCIPVP